ncbi:MAG: hypothetical protein C4293_05810 [Nitrospiraceae bacterium]
MRFLVVRRMSIVFCALALALVCIPQRARGTPDRRPVPEPRGYVSDHAGVLESEWKERIRSVCQDLERKTGVEMVVVIVKNPAPYSTTNEYASTIYQRWGIGTAQQEHGLLILAVVEERQAAITVGKGLIGVITPNVVEEVGRQYVEPAFRNGQFGEGLYRATVSLASAMQEIRIGTLTQPHRKGLAVVLTVLAGIGALILLWWISRPDLRHPFRRLHRGEFWGSGQGGFGGNFGGFGGGTSGEGLGQ